MCVCVFGGLGVFGVFGDGWVGREVGWWVGMLVGWEVGGWLVGWGGWLVGRVMRVMRGVGGWEVGG